MNAQVIFPEVDTTRPLCLMELTRATENTEVVIDGIIWARLHRMRARLQDALASQEYDLFVKTIYQVYESLSPERQARVLLSSEFCDCYLALDAANKRKAEAKETITDADLEISRTMAALYDLVCREEALQKLANGQVSPYLKACTQWLIYSPLGDSFAEKDHFGQWNLREVQKIGGCIAVDLDSPFARNHEPRSGVLSQACLTLSDIERNDVLSKLSTALDLIDEAEPLYGLIIRNFVRRIVVRKSQERSDAGPRHYGSEHVPRQPGSLRLLNVHQNELTIEACMESLMHESTHNFLAAWELANGFFVQNDYKYRVVSPWSGNQIPNSSFIHAVFVYYICHRLLKTHISISKNLSDDARSHVRKRLSVCAAGFLIEQRLSERIMTTKPLNSDIGILIDTMQRDMKHEYNYGARA